MADKKNKAIEIEKMISSIIEERDLSLFSYHRLGTYCDLSISEIRSLVAILNDYNILYPKKKVGLFKNKWIDEWNQRNVFNKTETDDEVIFDSGDWVFTFNRGELEKVNYDLNFEQCTVIKVLTIICMAHLELNFYYKKSFKVNPDNKKEILYSRTAYRATDEVVIFSNSHITTDYIVYR